MCRYYPIEDDVIKCWGLEKEVIERTTVVEYVYNGQGYEFWIDSPYRSMSDGIVDIYIRHDMEKRGIDNEQS